MLDGVAAPALELDLELPLPAVLVDTFADLEAQPSALPVLVERAELRGVVVDGVVAEGAPLVDGQGTEGAPGSAGVGEAGDEVGEDGGGDEVAAVEAGEQFGAFVDLGQGDGPGGADGPRQGVGGRGDGGAHTVSQVCVPVLVPVLVPVPRCSAPAACCSTRTPGGNSR
ncbi:hypothetical protein GCM10010357_54660 [Streptomyces luteireticuli]|uniref:Uncharacterized protein n=1 Tax=Streptomyces luteireticuli TaxID=173858 RepID=A0ABP3ITY3_9ACTN